MCFTTVASRKAWVGCSYLISFVMAAGQWIMSAGQWIISGAMEACSWVIYRELDLHPFSSFISDYRTLSIITVYQILTCSLSLSHRSTTHASYLATRYHVRTLGLAKSPSTQPITSVTVPKLVVVSEVIAT